MRTGNYRLLLTEVGSVAMAKVTYETVNGDSYLVSIEEAPMDRRSDTIVRCIEAIRDHWEEVRKQ